MIGLSFLAQKNAIDIIRVKNPMRTMDDMVGNFVYFDIPNFPPHEKVLEQTRVVVFHGMVNITALKQMVQIRKNPKWKNIKFVLDNDDLVWMPLPEWNNLRESYDKIVPKIIHLEKPWHEIMDLRTYSTPFLAKWANEHVYDGEHLILPNTLRVSDWYSPQDDIKKDLKKPVVMYCGSSTHYSNKKKLYGDWTEEWAAWVIESVKANKIEFHCIGGVPWFFEGIRDKIKTYPWISYTSFPVLIRSIKPNFSLNPLADCDFNRAKSDIKLVESSAMNCVCVGSNFDGSPYSECPIAIENADRGQIEKAIREACQKDVHNAMLKKQRDWFAREGRWTESPVNIARLKKAYFLEGDVK